MRVNGNLVFDAGRLKGVLIETFASNPTFDAAEVGRIYFNTSDSKFYYNDGTEWQALLPESESQPLNDKLTGLGEINDDTGFLAQTGNNTFAKRTFVGAAGRIAVSANADGVSGNPTIDLATVTNPGDGGFLVKIATDAYGRVVNSSPIDANDINSLLSDLFVNKDGDEMEGTLDMGGNTIANVGAAVLGTDAVNLNQLQAFVAGLSWKLSTRVATLENIPGFSAGTITIPNNNSTYFPDAGEPVTIDGVVVINDQRVLVKNQTNEEENGIYVVTNFGEGGSVDAVLTRAEDLSEGAEFTSASVLVTEGSQAGTGWTQTEIVNVVNTDDVIWVQFTGAGTFTAGAGISIAGTTFSVKLGAGIGAVPTDGEGGFVGIELQDPDDGALILTTDGSARSTDQTAKLHLLLDPEGNLEQSSSGLAMKPSYFLYESEAAADEHLVEHNIGQKYCNVTVVDSNDTVMIPQSIVFNDENSLTVTFSDDVECRVIVMGVAPPAP